MQSSKFLEDLARVDTANEYEFYDFLNATQIQPSANLPKDIPIGLHYGVQYFVKVSDIDVPQLRSDMTLWVEQDVFAGMRPTDDGSSAGTPQKEDGSSVGTSPSEALPLSPLTVGSPTGSPRPGGSPTESPRPGDAELYSGMFVFIPYSIEHHKPTTIDLSYGFGIGRLYHKVPDALQPQDTGFYVLCNASDKSIWVAFDFEPYGETGDIEQVRPEFGDPYGQLPGDKEELVIGVQKLFSGDWTAKKPLSLDHGDPFKNGAGKPLAVKLFAAPATINNVVDAIEAGRAKQGVGSDFAATSSFSAVSEKMGKPHPVP